MSALMNYRILTNWNKVYHNEVYVWQITVLPVMGIPNLFLNRGIRWFIRERRWRYQPIRESLFIRYRSITDIDDWTNCIHACTCQFHLCTTDAMLSGIVIWQLYFFVILKIHEGFQMLLKNMYLRICCKTHFVFNEFGLDRPFASMPGP